MKATFSGRAWLAACAGALAIAACGGNGDDNGYAAKILVTDTAAAANPYGGNSAHADAHLVNAWGIAFNPQGFVWVANAGTSTSTLYDGDGVPQSLVVTLPDVAGGEFEPTGIVFNGTSSFPVTQGGATAASVFVFAGEGGAIAGWSPTVDGTHAVVAVDRSAAGAIYKGLARATQGGVDLLFATDFHNGAVDVFDASFNKVTLAAGAFTDPNLPAGYAPFGIQAIGNQLYVSFAKQDANAEDDVAGAGFGAVDVFDTTGALVKRLVAVGGSLNAPWGMATAPANFGMFSNALLVGNFGDGTIHAFDATTGNHLGALSKTNGTPISIEGLWGIAFGNGMSNQPTNTLFFSAGPGDEAHGVYGRIDVR